MRPTYLELINNIERTAREMFNVKRGHYIWLFRLTNAGLRLIRKRNRTRVLLGLDIFDSYNL